MTKNEIIKHEQIGEALIVQVLHTNEDKNFSTEGVFVFRNNMMNQKELHFNTLNLDTSEHFTNPYAWFKPTAYGWDMARIMAKKLNNDLENDAFAAWDV